MRYCTVLLSLLLLMVSCGQNATSSLNRHPAHLRYSRHAMCRMECRHISESEVLDILQQGQVNLGKSELDDRRGPKYAVEGYSNGDHLRIVFADDPGAMVVVTCIDLDHEWSCPSCK